MASGQDDTVFGHALDDDDDNDESQSQSQDYEEEEDLAVNDDVLINEDDDDDDDVDEDLNSPSAAININVAATSIPVAVPSASSTAPSVVTIASVPKDGGEAKLNRIIETSVATTTTAIVHEEKKPPAILDDSRRLFQRLWTDEDEIELLQGFLDYTAQRGGGSSGGGGTHHHHHDTALFYDQIKSKLQLDFNKNQLVEKLRRLKKKYRNVVNKISSGKEFTFKSAHDQATFEISRKIWSDNGGRISGAGGAGVDDSALDDEDAHNANTNTNFCTIEIKSEDFGGEKRTMVTPGSGKSRSRKRPRSKLDIGIDDKRGLNEVLVSNTNNNNSNSNNNENSGGGGNGSGNGNVGVVAAAGVIEETVRSCLSPLFKELLNGTMMGMGAGGVGFYGGRGIGGLVMNAMPLSLGMPAMNFGGGEVAVDERWRKQQILELEVYSKRLELVQDQIKVALEELRSMGG